MYYAHLHGIPETAPYSGVGTSQNENPQILRATYEFPHLFLAPVAGPKIRAEGSVILPGFRIGNTAFLTAIAIEMDVRFPAVATLLIEKMPEFIVSGRAISLVTYRYRLAVRSHEKTRLTGRYTCHSNSVSSRQSRRFHQYERSSL